MSTPKNTCPMFLSWKEIIYRRLGIDIHATAGKGERGFAATDTEIL